MSKVKLTLFAAAAALAASAGGASAMQINGSLAAQNDSLVENVRIICNDRGRCWEVRRGHRVYVAPPRHRHVHRHHRHHRHHHDHHRGVGIGPVGIYAR